MPYEDTCWSHRQFLHVFWDFSSSAVCCIHRAAGGWRQRSHSSRNRSWRRSKGHVQKSRPQHRRQNHWRWTQRHRIQTWRALNTRTRSSLMWRKSLLCSVRVTDRLLSAQECTKIVFHLSWHHMPVSLFHILHVWPFYWCQCVCKPVMWFAMFLSIKYYLYNIFSSRNDDSYTPENASIIKKFTKT